MFQGSPHHAVLPAGLGWPAHAQKEKPRVSMQNIYFCDFAQKLRLQLFLSAHLMMTQKQVKSCPDYYAFQVVWLTHSKTRY